MDTQRLLLLIAIFFTGFLLWQEWQIKDLPTNQGNNNNNATLTNTESSNQTTLPTVSDNNITDLPEPVATPNSTPDIQVNNALEGSDVVTVITDVFSVKINTKGGTLQEVKLIRYPVSLEDKQNVIEIIRNQPQDIFHIQSGLISTNDLPTHHSLYQSRQLNYVLEGDELIVPLTWRNERGVSVTKYFRFKRNNYEIDVYYDLNNQSDATLTPAAYVQLVRDRPEEDGQFMGMSIYTGGAFYNEEDKYQKIDFDDFASQPKINTQGGWMAMVQHYFLVSVMPAVDKIQHYSSKVINGLHFLSLVNSAQSVAPGNTITTDINKIYVGPKEQRRLETISDSLDRTVDYGFLYIIAKPLSWLINQIYNLVGSWGWSIILLTVLIKLVFYKLSETSYRSMAKMRKLTPKMKRLKELYGDDKQKVSQKMMELYKTEKVNPASGCLPIVVQIPVFIALYWVLLDSVELRQTPFWWLADLSAQDPYYILPLVMGASMFIQQRLNPQPADPIQAKVMMFLPIVFTIFFLWFPSGLVLYWVTNNGLSILQQWIITKRMGA